MHVCNSGQFVHNESNHCLNRLPRLCSFSSMTATIPSTLTLVKYVLCDREAEPETSRPYGPDMMTMAMTISIPITDVTGSSVSECGDLGFPVRLVSVGRSVNIFSFLYIQIFF